MNLYKDKVIEEWKIDIDKLIHPAKNFVNYDFGYRGFENKSSNLALILYDIAEIRMGWEVGRLAIFENKTRPKLIFNSKNLLCFNTSDTIQFSKKEDLIFLKAFISEDNRIEVPFLILNLKDELFSIIKLINSLPYKIEETTSNLFKLIEKYKDNRFESYNGKTIDISKLDWLPMNNIEEINRIYFDKQTASNKKFPFRLA